MFVIAVLQSCPAGLGNGRKHLNHKHAVMRNNRTPALANDVRVWHTFLIAHLAGSSHYVVRVFRKRVVGAALKRRAATVVVHCQPTTDIKVTDWEIHLPQLRIKSRTFLHCLLDREDIRHLRTNVEMQQLETPRQTLRPKQIRSCHQLRGCQAKLCVLPAAVRPLAS